MSTNNIPFSIYIKKNTLIYPKAAAMGFFFHGAHQRVQNISVGAIEVRLYLV